MRLAHALAACLLATVIAGSASAQKPSNTQAPTTKVSPSAKITPNQVIAATPANRDGVKLVTPPGFVLVTPSFSATQFDAAKARKVAAAGRWGLVIRQEALQPSFWITPQQPYIAGGASLFIANETSTTPNFASTPTMPYGSIAMSRTPTGAWWVSIKDAPVTAKDWILVDCYLAGGDTYRMWSILPRTPGSSGAGVQVMRTGLTPSGGVVSALIEPSTLGKRDIYISGNGSAPGTWTFGGCEVTPIRP